MTVGEAERTFWSYCMFQVVPWRVLSAGGEPDRRAAAGPPAQRGGEPGAGSGAGGAGERPSGQPGEQTLATAQRAAREAPQTLPWNCGKRQTGIMSRDNCKNAVRGRRLKTQVYRQGVYEYVRKQVKSMMRQGRLLAGSCDSSSRISASVQSPQSNIIQFLDGKHPPC